MQFLGRKRTKNGGCRLNYLPRSLFIFLSKKQEKPQVSLVRNYKKKWHIFYKNYKCKKKNESFLKSTQQVKKYLG